LDLAGLEIPELEAALEARGGERFHARQVYRWIYKRGIVDFERMTDLSKGLRSQLASEFTLTTPVVMAESRSIDGTRKFVLELADGRRIEAVFIPDTPAMTFCISTQVGCAMGCGFCLTGKMGLVRNLTAGEIAGQVRVLAAAPDCSSRQYVLMGRASRCHYET
jgi:23S rRNA (adenine2503-C2)-methyltransferase